MAITADKPKCGVVMPISASEGCSSEHWEHVLTIVRESLADAFQVELVSDSNEIGIIQKRIVQNLYENDLVVCDVSCKNPNVMFELGMRLAFDKPTVIIKDEKTNYSFDTGQIEHLEYPRDLHYHSIQAFKKKLSEKASATLRASKRSDYTTFLKNFGSFVVAKIDERPVGRDEFLLNSLNELREELKVLTKRVTGEVSVERNMLLRMLIDSGMYKAPSSKKVLLTEAFAPPDFPKGGMADQNGPSS